MSSVILLKNRSIPNDPYEKVLEDNGYSTFFVPLLNHAPSNLEETVTYLQSEEFLSKSVIIITSQRGVEILGQSLSLIKDEDLKSNIYNKVAYTVGPATEKALHERGFVNIKGGMDAGNGSILADIIIEEVKRDQSIVFFTGEIRKDVLPKKLRNSGMNLVEKVIYKTEERSDIEYNFQEAFNNSKTFPWIVFFSPQGTKSIITFLKEKKNEIKVASIGPTTEEYLKKTSIAVDITPQLPEAQSLLDSILKSDHQK